MDTTQVKSGLTIDMIIAKFVPILGALLFITGFGYLIYTSVWAAMSETIRLGVGFFASFVIIGTAFSFSDRLRYFADVVMGGGILLLYGTLIYGSRTTDAAIATIPEVATLVTAFIFTLGVAYFSSLRKSKVILVLGIIGAYITPFVIGQNDVWASNISFNAYLIYFAAVNIVIFLMGREIAIHDLIPLNLLGLFFGTYTLHSLVYQKGIQEIGTGFFQSTNFTVVLLVVLVAMSVLSIASSARYFSSNEEGWISTGYLLPLLWFFFHIDALAHVSSGFQAGAFLVISIAYFVAWHFLRPLESTRYQHVAAYAGALISIVFAINSLFEDFNLYASLIISYIAVVFQIIYILEGNKGERLMAAFLFSFFGAILTLSYIYGANNTVSYPTLFAVLSLIPAIFMFPAVSLQQKTPASMVAFVKVYSALALMLAIFISAIKLLQEIDFTFAIFILPGCIMVLSSYFQGNKNPTRGTLMRSGVIWFSIGFFSTFIYFISNLAPTIADNEHFWINGGIFANWHWIKGVFALVTYFLALSVSRQIQREQKIDRPSFLLVILGYTTLLLVVNFMIITFCNDIGIAKTTGGIRAIGTTIWWVILAISMLMTGIHHGYGYRSEKLIGLILLLLTIGKIGLYDLQAMTMDKKIVVLMVVGGLIMMFSYFLQIKGYLKEEPKV